MIGLLAHIDGLRVISHTASFSSATASCRWPRSRGGCRPRTCSKAACARTANACASACTWSRPAAIAPSGRRPSTANCATSSSCSATSPTRSPMRCELQLGLLPARSQAGEDPALYRRYLLARNASPRVGEDRAARGRSRAARTDAGASRLRAGPGRAGRRSCGCARCRRNPAATSCAHKPSRRRPRRCGSIRNSPTRTPCSPAGPAGCSSGVECLRVVAASAI